MKRSGIYFLIWRNKIIYIGQSIDLDRRMYEHRWVRFSYYREIECHPSKLREYEKRLIVYFRPRYNRWLNPDFLGTTNKCEYLPLRMA